MGSYVEDETRIGLRVRRIRRAQGKSLATIAELAGIKGPYLSLLERGERRWDSRSLIQAVADALGVAPAVLLGQPFTDSPAGIQIDQGVRRIRTAITNSSLDYGADAQARHIDALTAETAAVTRLRMASDYVQLGARLPSLISELHTLGTDRALRLLCEALGAASHMLTVTGSYAESLLASDRRAQAARRLGDQREAASVEWSRAHALVPDGATWMAYRAASTAADALPGHPANLPTLGALLLVSAYAAAVQKDWTDAHARLDEAERIAERTGETAAPFVFGPSNVRLHRMSAALEAREPDRTLQWSKGVQTATVGSPERLAMFHIDRGRSLAYIGRDAEAVEAFTLAEKVAPHRTHASPFARDAVANILDSARRLAGGARLTALASRFGVLT